MPDLLLELFSEEIPARMQAKAAEDLQKLVTGKLVDAGLVYEGAKAFATPRRLAPAVEGIPARQPDLQEERKDPPVGANAAAIAGVRKAAGLASIDQAVIQNDPQRSDYYIALVAQPAKAKVVLDPARRAEIILTDAKNLAFAQGFELVEDAGLLAEVAGLVEWPVVLIGSFDAEFLAIPPEVIRATIRNNQKCFVLRSAAPAPFETPAARPPHGQASRNPHP